MSQFSDPYQPPMSSNAPQNTAETETFRNIAFWQNFFCVLGYIACGLTLLGFMLNLALAAASGNVGRLIGALIGTVFGMAIAAVTYAVPAFLLGKASQATRNFGEGRIGLGEYANEQKKFWRYSGIMVSIMLVLYAGLALLLVAGLILFGASTSWR